MQQIQLVSGGLTEEGCPLSDPNYPTGTSFEPLSFDSYATEPDTYSSSLGVSPESDYRYNMEDDYSSNPLGCLQRFGKLQDDRSNGSLGSQDFPQPQCPGMKKFESVFPFEVKPESPPTIGEKRPVKRLASCHGFGDENIRSSKERKKSEDGAETNQRSLACPFYKHDSYKYHDCRQNVLRRIKDVKQHIIRKHRKPDFYCPVCFETFDEAILRDAHIQERGCTSQSDPIYDGISADQKKALGQYSGRGKLIECQWNDVWHVIFPESAPPKSPYLGNYREEIIPQIRDFWNEKRDQITSSVLQTQPVNDHHTQFVYSLMEDIFNRFEEESSRWTPLRGPANRYEPVYDSPPSHTSELVNCYDPDGYRTVYQKLGSDFPVDAMNMLQFSGYRFDFVNSKVP